jgi:hypothetical protein
MGTRVRLCTALTIAAVIMGATSGFIAASSAAGAAALSIGDAAVWEGDAGGTRAVTFAVVLSQPVTTTVTVQYRLEAGTATTADFDNVGGAARTLTFASGAISRFLTVNVKADTLDEKNETFTVRLMEPMGAMLRKSTATGTILDDDPGTGVRLAVGDASVPEGDGGPAHSIAFPVTLSRPSTTTVTVTVHTMPGTASDGSDFVGKSAGITFAAGQIRKEFTVSVKPDTVVEPNETFTVMAMDATNATISDDSATGTILSEELPGYTTQSFRIGPFNLAPAGQSGSENQATGAVPRPPGAIGVKGMRFDIVDQSGASVGMHDVHLHHIVMLDRSRTDAVCPGLGFNRFFGSGKERTPLALPGNYAYRVGANDTWSALWHVMNMTSQAKTVYIRYEIDYVAATNPLAARGVTTYWYDVDGCWGDSEFNVPGNGGPGSVYTLSRTYTAPRSGTRVATGGHFHDGGLDITLRRTATGATVCKNTGIYDMDMLHTITACTTTSSVAANEQFTTTVRYRNEQPILGAMGIQLSYIWEP